MKVLVTGGRHYANREAVFAALDRLLISGPVEYLVNGGATGADALAVEWADENKVPVATFQANWKKHGRAAGPIRNRLMLINTKPDLVVAFPGGAGTADMVRQAVAAGVDVLSIEGD